MAGGSFIGFASGPPEAVIPPAPPVRFGGFTEGARGVYASEVGTEVWVARGDERFPTLNESDDVARIASGPSARGFMVDEFCQGFIEDAESSTLESQAIIDVIEVDAQRLVKAAVILEDVTAGDETGTRDSGALASGHGHSHVSAFRSAEPHQHVAGSATQTENDATMLQATVRIQQTSPGSTDVVSSCLGAEHVQPSRCDRLDVIVEEDQEVTRRVRHGRIVEFGPVEGPVVVHDVDVRPRS
jgi:hypothetical protein